LLQTEPRNIHGYFTYLWMEYFLAKWCACFTDSKSFDLELFINLLTFQDFLNTVPVSVTLRWLQCCWIS